MICSSCLFMLLLFANNILVYFLVNIMSTVDLTFLQKEQKNDEKMNLYFVRCRRGPPGSGRTWRWRASETAGLASGLSD